MIMKLSDIADPKVTEPHHAEALRKTGFWGKAGAGSIFLARSTGRIGIAQRSNHPPPHNVEQPGTWGTIGGAIDPESNAMEAAIKEAAEEVGYTRRPHDFLTILDVFHSGSFQYTTFVYVVDDEFEAHLNWEAQDFGWFHFGEWPEPLHFGLTSTLSKPLCKNLLIELISRHHVANNS